LGSEQGGKNKTKERRKENSGKLTCSSGRDQINDTCGNNAFPKKRDKSGKKEGGALKCPIALYSRRKNREKK